MALKFVLEKSFFIVNNTERLPIQKFEINYKVESLLRKLSLSELLYGLVK